MTYRDNMVSPTNEAPCASPTLLSSCVDLLGMMMLSWNALNMRSDSQRVPDPVRGGERGVEGLKKRRGRRSTLLAAAAPFRSTSSGPSGMMVHSAKMKGCTYLGRRRTRQGSGVRGGAGQVGAHDAQVGAHDAQVVKCERRTSCKGSTWQPRRTRSSWPVPVAVRLPCGRFLRSGFRGDRSWERQAGGVQRGLLQVQDCCWPELRHLPKLGPRHGLEALAADGQVGVALDPAERWGGGGGGKCEAQGSRCGEEKVEGGRRRRKKRIEVMHVQCDAGDATLMGCDRSRLLCTLPEAVHVRRKARVVLALRVGPKANLSVEVHACGRRRSAARHSHGKGQAGQPPSPHQEFLRGARERASRKSRRCR